MKNILVSGLSIIMPVDTFSDRNNDPIITIRVGFNIKFNLVCIRFGEFLNSFSLRVEKLSTND